MASARARAAAIDDARTSGLGEEALRRLEEVDARVRDGDLPSAELAVARLVDCAPNHPEVLRTRAVLLQLQGRQREAARLLRRVLRHWPEDTLAWNNLGTALIAIGDRAGSIDAFRTAADLAPERAASWFNLGLAHDAESRSDDAYEALSRALECDADHLPSRVTRARVLQTMGRIDEAHQDYRLAVRSAPDSARAWFGLSTLRTAPFDDEDLASMERLYARQDLAQDDRIRLGFALADALFDHGRLAESFAILCGANAAKRKTLGWNAEAFTRYLDDIDAKFAATHARAKDDALGAEIVFVTGMPRSGTTLVEQILAAHAAVDGGDELTVLPELLAEESRRRGSDFPAWVPDMSDEDWARLGREYLERTRRWRRGGSRFTDKGLANWRYVGAALAMLPGARFVICRRDPVETCLSCFSRLFAAEQGYTYDIGELAAHWRDHDRTARRWRERRSDRVHELVHEDLVRSPEDTIRALLEFCGLPFDPACLRFHEAERDVRTASAAQVRRPLSTDTAKAYRYGPLLDPLRRALAGEDAPAPPEAE